LISGMSAIMIRHKRFQIIFLNWSVMRQTLGFRNWRVGIFLNFSGIFCCVPGTAHVLKGEPIISRNGSQGSSQAQPDGGEGHSVITTGYPVTVPRKTVALLRQSSTKARGDVQKSSQACICGTSLQHKVKSSIHYRQCPYTRRLRAERRVFTPGGLPCATGYRVRQKMAESRATCSDRMEEVSRGHSNRRKTSRESHGGLTPVKARTVPGLNSTGK